MTNRFVCSSITQKTIRFKVQIEDYSKYACKGYYISPEFGKSDCESKWSLLVHVYDGADHENFIDVRLQRHDYATETQFVTVKTSIVNCFGFNVLKNERKILVGGSNEARILAVAKEQLKGLKKHFYLPKDTLTLQCDLSIHESSAVAYKKKENFVNNTFYQQSNISQYFARSRLVKKAEDYFVRKITDFSVQSYGGLTITPEFRSENLGGSWSLVVCNTTDNNSSEYLDIRLVRRESYEQQLVKIRLTITDPLHNELLSKEKFAFFTSSREVQILSSTKTFLSSWYGLRKKQLIPNDTLTLRCEMVLYEQVDDTFTRKEDYNNTVETSGYAPMQLFPYFLAICFVLPVILHIFHRLCLAVMPVIWYTILDIFERIILFVSFVSAIVFMFYYIQHKAEDIKYRKYVREIKRKLREKKQKMMFEKNNGYNRDSFVKNDFQNYRKSKHTNNNKEFCYNNQSNYSNQQSHNY